MSGPQIRAQDFFVQTPGDYYTFNGGTNENPVLTLVRGQTYTFEIDARFDHQFYISPDDGVYNNNIYQGTITYNVPIDVPNDTVVYFCYQHSWGNQIQFVDPPPPPPPPIAIVGLTVGTNLVLKSTGTNTWLTIPEYSTNLLSTNWYALTVQTNRFNGGTNETICGRPPGNAVFLRIRAQWIP